MEEHMSQGNMNKTTKADPCKLIRVAQIGTLRTWPKSGHWEDVEQHEIYSLLVGMQHGMHVWWLFTKLNILLCFSNSVLLHVSERKKFMSRQKPAKKIKIKINK